MRVLQSLAAVVPLFLLTNTPGSAQAPVDSAAFIVRLGTDTTAVERWIRTGDRIEAISVSRSPRTTTRRYTLRLDAQGRVTHIVDANGERAVTPPGAIPIAGGFYAPYALAISYAAAQSGNAAVKVPMLVGNAVREFEVTRKSAREFTTVNQFDVPMTVRLDESGRVTFIDASGGSTVERVRWFDIDAVGREFTARDERGQGLGPLSPRDTARLGTFMIDYSRPSARGRQIMGGLIPIGEVWRTGANDATQLIIDQTVQLGSMRLAPGRYSLFTIPNRDGWELIVNRQTGISGLDRDAAQDVGRVAMRVRTLPQHVEKFTIAVANEGGGGVLRIQWGTTEAFVPFTIVR